MKLLKCVPILPILVFVILEGFSENPIICHEKVGKYYTNCKRISKELLVNKHKKRNLRRISGNLGRTLGIFSFVSHYIQHYRIFSKMFKDLQERNLEEIFEKIHGDIIAKKNQPKHQQWYYFKCTEASVVK